MLKAELKLKTCGGGLHIPEPREDVEGRAEVEDVRGGTACT